MGDLKKKPTLQEIAAEREARSTTPKTGTLKKLTENEPKTKDKIISAKVYPEMWARFTAINKAQGMTNNSALNMILTKYVREQEEILNNN